MARTVKGLLKFKKKEIEKKTQPGWEALPIRSMNGLLTRMMRNDG